MRTKIEKLAPLVRMKCTHCGETSVFWLLRKSVQQFFLTMGEDSPEEVKPSSGAPIELPDSNPWER